LQDADPAIDEYPGLQLSQTAEPGSDEKVPAGQLAQDPPEVEDWPAGQLVQDPPEVEYWPAGQLVQELEPAAEY